MLQSHQEYEQETFANLDDSSQEIISSNFFNCTFKNCNLSEANLSGSTFTKCSFVNCNLSLVKLTGVNFSETTFTNCKLMGDNFEVCKFDFGFSPNFINCVLELANFSGVNPYSVVNGSAVGLPSGQTLFVSEAGALGFSLSPFVPNAVTYSYGLF